MCVFCSLPLTGVGLCMCVCVSVFKYIQNTYIRTKKKTGINDIESLILAINDKACDCVNIKISKFGGLTKAKEARDLCVRHGIAMCIEGLFMCLFVCLFVYLFAFYLLVFTLQS